MVFERFVYWVPVSVVHVLMGLAVSTHRTCSSALHNSAHSHSSLKQTVTCCVKEGACALFMNFYLYYFNEFVFMPSCSFWCAEGVCTYTLCFLSSRLWHLVCSSC